MLLLDFKGTVVICGVGHGLSENQKVALHESPWWSTATLRAFGRAQKPWSMIANGAAFQEHWNLSLHLHHRLQANIRRSVRGELRQAVLDHLPAEGFQRDGEEMLQAGRQGVRRERARGLPDCVRVVLHHEVHGEGAGGEADRGDELREAAGGDLWRWMLLRGGGGGVSRHHNCHSCWRSGGSLWSESAKGDLFTCFTSNDRKKHHSAQNLNSFVKFTDSRLTCCWFQTWWLFLLQTCRLVTRLVPRLEPSRQCTIVPKETCQLTFSRSRAIFKIKDNIKMAFMSISLEAKISV